MVNTLVVLLAGAVFFAACVCALVRGGAINERERREAEARRNRVSAFRNLKQPQ